MGVTTCKDAFVVSEHGRSNVVQVHGSLVPILMYCILFYSVVVSDVTVLTRVSSPVTVSCKTGLLDQHNVLNA